jgi:hypothetical protein
LSLENILKSDEEKIIPAFSEVIRGDNSRQQRADNICPDMKIWIETKERMHLIVVAFDQMG